MCSHDSTPSYLRPYLEAEKRHGAGFRATLWANRASQRRRFDILAETYSLTGRRILDAGAGMGDLLAYLEETERPPSHYVGLDALVHVTDAARQRVFKTPAEFLCGNLLERPALLRHGAPEVVVLSGTLNAFSDAEFRRLLDLAFEATERCLLFNFLSTRHSDRFPADAGISRRRDPLRVFEYGLNHTRSVIVRHDYFDGHDCTMAWLKEPADEN